MESQDHLDLLKQGVEVWNQWREDHPEIKPNLIGANLVGAKLSGANLNRALLQRADLSPSFGLYRADLRNADLSQADLSQADLRSADLSGANLSQAILGSGDWLPGQATNRLGANLNFANLSFANLRETVLFATDLSGCNLSQADLSGAIACETTFAQVDLRNTKGLVEIVHEGPSFVALNAIQLPQDSSALHFLRGVGIPDQWIDFYCTTLLHPIQYHSCFISYSSKDDVLARRLHADLHDHGVRCWFAPKNMKIGDKIRARIDDSIHLHDKLLLVLLEHSVASQWVEQEVETALEKERKEQRIVLFPLRLDNAVMESDGGWPSLIRNTRYIGDFTRWKQHEDYQNAFDRLLRDLLEKSEKSSENGR